MLPTIRSYLKMFISNMDLQIKVASYLLTILERIAARLEAYYASLSQESIYRPEIENNPARTRWHNVRRKIVDGSFFVLAEPVSLSSSGDFASGLQTRAGPHSVQVDFAQIFASAQETLQSNSRSLSPYQQSSPQQPRRLADMHTARAAQSTQAPSTFETQQQSIAIKRMSNFINSNMSTIRRLSRLPATYDFNDIMAAYGKQASVPSRASPIHAKSPSSTSSHSSQGLRVRGDSTSRSLSPLPAPQPLRVNARTPSLERNIQLNHRQPPSAQLPPLPSAASTPVAHTPTPSMNAAMVHLNRRQPPRSTTPLPASPRASLALSATSTRRKMSGDAPLPPVPGIPSVTAGLRALKLAANLNGDELRFQQLQAKV